jgi:hypothetical protein
MVGEIRAPTPESSGYSLVCREVDGGGTQRFLVKNGKCYSADDEKRYLGTIEEMSPQKPTQEQLDAEWRRLKTKFNL